MLCWCCVRRTANESPYHTPSHLFRQNDPFFMAKFNNPWLIQQPLICRPSELLWSSSHSSPANLSLSPRPMVASPSIPRRAIRGTLNCCRRDWGQQRLMYYSKVNLLKCESSNFPVMYSNFSVITRMMMPLVLPRPVNIFKVSASWWILINVRQFFTRPKARLQRSNTHQTCQIDCEHSDRDLLFSICWVCDETCKPLDQWSPQGQVTRLVHRLTGCLVACLDLPQC